METKITKQELSSGKKIIKKSAKWSTLRIQTKSKELALAILKKANSKSFGRRMSFRHLEQFCCAVQMKINGLFILKKQSSFLIKKYLILVLCVFKYLG